MRLALHALGLSLVLLGVGLWLATGRDHKLSLSMRLYDTPLFANGGLASLAMPEIVPVRCS